MKNYEYYVITYYCKSGEIANINGFNTIAAAYKYMRPAVKLLFQTLLIDGSIFATAENLEEERRAAKEYGIFE